MVFTIPSLIIVFIAILLGETFGTLFGGGGFIIQPALLAVGVPAHQAIANDIVAASFASWAFLIFSKHNNWRVKKKIVQYMVAPLILGAFAGGSVIVLISPIALTYMVMAICSLGFIYTVFKIFNPAHPAVDGVQELSPVKHWKICAVFFGVLLGLYDGISGAGGGILMLLVLSFVFRYDMKVTISAANLLSGISLTAAGVVFFLHGLLDWRLLAIMVPSCLIAGMCGAKIANVLPEKTLRIAYALVVLALLLYLSYKQFF